MTHPKSLRDGSIDVADDLARNLPRWVGWIPVAGKASYKWWSARKRRRSPEARVVAKLSTARIEINAVDDGSIELRFSLVNFGNRPVEVDRLELHRLSVGARNLQRKSDMIKMTGTLAPQRIDEMTVGIDLNTVDIRSVVQGITNATNSSSSPQVSVSVYADILCIAGKRRFRKTVDHSASCVASHVLTDVVQALIANSKSST